MELKHSEIWPIRKGFRVMSVSLVRVACCPSMGPWSMSHWGSRTSFGRCPSYSVPKCPKNPFTEPLSAVDLASDGWEKFFFDPS